MSDRRGRPRLSDLEGIRPVRARSLEKAGFRTFDDVSDASEEDLETAQGIGGFLATKIKQDVDRVQGGVLLDPDSDREGNTEWRHLQTFERPMYHGYRLDWCRKRGKDCGQAAAAEWARRMFLNFKAIPGVEGLEKSDRVRDFSKDEDVGLTRVVDSDEPCTSRGCDGFARITIG